MAEERWSTTSAAETRRVGAEWARRLTPDGVLLLSGDLGAGKTVLAQGIGGALGVEMDAIVSPTYVLILEHEGSQVPFVHVDLYRLEAEEVEVLGLEELLAGPGVKVVEWPDRLPFEVPGAVRATIRRRSKGTEASETGETSEALDGDSEISGSEAVDSERELVWRSLD